MLNYPSFISSFDRRGGRSTPSSSRILRKSSSLSHSHNLPPLHPLDLVPLSTLSTNIFPITAASYFGPNSNDADSSASDKENTPPAYSASSPPLKRQRTVIVQIGSTAPLWSPQGGNVEPPPLDSPSSALLSPSLSSPLSFFSPSSSSSSVSLSSPSFFHSPANRMLLYEDGEAEGGGENEGDVDMVPETPVPLQGVSSAIHADDEMNNYEQVAEEKDEKQDDESGERIVPDSLPAIPVNVHPVLRLGRRRQLPPPTLQRVPRDPTTPRAARSRPALDVQRVDNDLNNEPQRALSDRAQLMRRRRSEVLDRPLYDGCVWTVLDAVLALQKVSVSQHSNSTLLPMEYQTHPLVVKWYSVESNNVVFFLWFSARPICRLSRSQETILTAFFRVFLPVINEFPSHRTTAAVLELINKAEAGIRPHKVPYCAVFTLSHNAQRAAGLPTCNNPSVYYGASQRHANCSDCGHVRRGSQYVKSMYLIRIADWIQVTDTHTTAPQSATNAVPNTDYSPTLFVRCLSQALFTRSDTRQGDARRLLGMEGACTEWRDQRRDTV